VMLLKPLHYTFNAHMRVALHGTPWKMAHVGPLLPPGVQSGKQMTGRVAQVGYRQVQTRETISWTEGI
jgi:hypothetical protein